MSTVRQCDRCQRTMIEGEGAILILHDTANQDVDDVDYESRKPPPRDIDLCSTCRVDLGDFLGLAQTDDLSDIVADLDNDHPL